MNVIKTLIAVALVAMSINTACAAPSFLEAVAFFWTSADRDVVQHHGDNVLLVPSSNLSFVVSDEDQCLVKFTDREGKVQ